MEINNNNIPFSQVKYTSVRVCCLVLMLVVFELSSFGSVTKLGGGGDWIIVS
jgi:hypothetical protein